MPTRITGQNNNVPQHQSKLLTTTGPASSPPNSEGELDSDWGQLNSEIIDCRLCPRLVKWREQISREKRRAYRDCEYWGRPVPGFGDRKGRLLIVGLAPGAHGSNRTGRMFTGDSSGNTLFPALHKEGFANQPYGHTETDDMALIDTFITSVARCAPPANRPTAAELSSCRPYLIREWELMPQVEIVLALGKMAFDGCLLMLRNLGYDIPKLKFSHGLHRSIACSALEPRQIHLLASYHPSRQNTQTGRLTVAMFDQVFETARFLLTQPSPNGPMP